MKRVKLADLPIKWLRGNGYRKADLVTDGEYGCILYGELFTKYKSPLIQPSSLSRTKRKGNIQTITGDILIPGTSTAKKSDMVLGREVNVDGVFLGGDINVLRPQQGLFASKFLPYFLESQEAFKQLEPYIQGATGIIHLSNTGIKRLKVPLPTLHEQQRIVAILDEAFAAIDQAKANTERNLKNAKELFDSYLKEVFEKKGEGWEEKKLVEVCEIGDGNYSSKYPKASEFVQKGVPFLTATNIKSGTVVSDGIRFISKEQHSTLTKGHIKTGDLVIVVRGSNTGNNSLVPENYSGSNLNSQLAYLRTKDSGFLNCDYLFAVFNSPSVMKKVKSEISGAAQPQLPNNKLLDISINIPSLQEQQTIVRQLDALRAEIQKLEAVYQKKLSDLDELKKSILQKAFTGELTTT